MKIKSVTISKMPDSICDKLPVVTAIYEDGSSEELFDFYPDEISFTPEELVGLSFSEALDLKVKKDKEFLQC
jgi:hypothetical protein